MLRILANILLVLVFPGKTAEIHGIFQKDATPRWVRLEGQNTPAISVRIK